MSETAELAAALAAAQAELPEVKKNRTADVNNKEGRKLYSYSYADLADVSAAVLPVLGKHGLAFTAFPGHQQDGKFGLRYYLLHSSGGSLEGFFEIDDKGGMQLVGGRITYARRYCLCAVTGITADEDVDARDDSPSRAVQRQPSRSAGSRQPERAAPRTQTSPPVKAGHPRAGPVTPSGTGGDLPPLPGEEDAPGPAVPAPPEAGPGAPGDERHKKLVGIVQAHFKRLGYTDEDREERLVAASLIAGIPEVPSLNELTHEELSAVADTLAKCRDRERLLAVLAARENQRGDEAEVPGGE